MEPSRLRRSTPLSTGTCLRANSLRKQAATDLDGARQSCVRAARGPSGHLFFSCINRRNRRASSFAAAPTSARLGHAPAILAAAHRAARTGRGKGRFRVAPAIELTRRPPT